MAFLVRSVTTRGLVDEQNTQPCPPAHPPGELEVLTYQAAFEQDLRDWWDQYRGNPKKLARLLGVNENMMMLMPPSDYPDLLNKVNQKIYWDLSAGKFPNDDEKFHDDILAVCVARVQAFAMVNGLQTKYSKIAGKEALKGVIINGVNSWNEISPVMGVVAWNEKNNKLVVGPDDRFAARVSVTLYRTGDFVTSISIIKRMNSCGAGPLCALIVLAPPGSSNKFHAVSVQHASEDEMSIQAMDYVLDGVPHTVTKDNFIELVLYDVFATREDGMEHPITNPDYVGAVQRIAKEDEVWCVAGIGVTNRAIEKAVQSKVMQWREDTEDDASVQNDSTSWFTCWPGDNEEDEKQADHVFDLEDDPICSCRCWGMCPRRTQP